MENPNDTIPTPITSGATDHPDAPQSGTAQAPPTPAGFFDTPPATAPPTPAGFFDTPPAPHLGPNGQPNPTNVYRATDEESTPEGAAAALAREQQHPILSGIGQGAESLLQPVFHPIDTVENIVKQSLPPFQVYDSLKKAYPLIQTYENARSQGQSVWQSIAAANDHARQQDAAAQAVDKAIADYKKNPTQTTAKILTQVAGTVAMLAAGGSGATAEAETPAIAPTAAETAPAAEATEAAETSKLTNPVESAVNKAVTKSNLPEGQPASVAPTGEDIQPNLQQGIRDTMKRIAEKEGVAPSTAPSIRGVVEETADNVYAKSKAQFAPLDEATGGNVSRYDNQIRNVNRALQNVTDDAEETKLLARKANLEASQEAAFEQAKAKGVDPKLVDEAKANYKKAQALYDVDNQVKMSTSGSRPNIGKPGAQTPEIVDPKKLSNRLNKVYDSGRLQEAAGEDEAQALLTHADDAQLAGQQIKEFVPASPTGQKALADLIRKNTVGKSNLLKLGKVEGSTDWNATVKDFENLTPDTQKAMFGEDVTRVRQYLGRQALKQNALNLVVGKTAVGHAVRLGLAEEAIRRTF
jgi:hypothetical protein